MPTRSVVAKGNDGSLGVRVSSRSTLYPISIGIYRRLMARPHRQAWTGPPAVSGAPADPAVAGAAGSMSTVDSDRLCKLALRRMSR